MKYRFMRGLGAVLLLCVAQHLYGATISPQPLQVTVAQDQVLTVTRQVVLDDAGPATSKIDVFFLADNTGSMGGAINNVRNNAAEILQLIAGGDTRFEGIDVQFGVASYNGDPREFGGSVETRISRAIRLLQPVTPSQTDTQAAINQWRASGGGDGPEANFFALHQLATNGGATDGVGSTDLGYESNYNFGWREDARRLIVWFGDYRSHTTTVDRAEVIDALQGNSVIVAAINTRGQNSGIDAGGEAQAIVDATQGYIAHNVRAAAQTVDAILNSVQNATQTVDLELQTRNLPTGISVEYACASDLGCDDVTVGESRDFTMTITGLDIGEYEFETYVPFLADTTSTDSVRVRACLTDLDARGSRSKISVTWEDTGAASYNVYRSLTGLEDFELIGNTVNRYSTYGDRDVLAGTTYYYQVKEVDANGIEYCESLIAETSTGSRFRSGPINQSPIISSTPLLNAIEDSVYRYDIVASDPEGDALSYALAVAPNGMTISETGSITWLPANSQIGENVVSVIVSDSEGLTDTQTFNVRVDNVNDAPSIISAPNEFARVGEIYSYVVQALDEDFGDILTFELIEQPASMTIDSITGLVQWVPAYGDGPSAPVTIRVIDQSNAFADQSFVINVDEPNRAPSITTSPTIDALSDTEYTYDVDAIDPDTGDTLSFSLSVFPPGMVIESNTGLIEWQPTREQVGIHPVTVVVEDASGLPDSQSFEITVVRDNLAPVITSVPPQEVLAGQEFTYSLAATDADGDDLTWSIVSGPSDLVINASNQLVWMTSESVIGVHPIQVMVSDNFGGEDTQFFELNVQPVPNGAPVVVSSPIVEAIRDLSYEYVVEVTDPENDPIQVNLIQGPAFLSINGLSVFGTPTLADVGIHEIALSISDGTNFVNQSYNLTVLSQPVGNSAPEFTSSPELSVLEGDVWSYQVSAFDSQNDDVTYQLLSAPAGMLFSVDTLQWNTLVNQTGSFEVQIEAADSWDATSTQTFSLIVTENNAPIITSLPTPEVVEGNEYLYAVVANDPENRPLLYSLENEPSGASVDTNGLIRWQTAVGDEGIVTFDVRVADHLNEVAVQTIDVSVLSLATNSAPVIISTPSTIAEAESAYFYEVEASDADGDLLNYALLSSPLGMTIDSSSGLISWTPTSAQLGGHLVEVVVNDGNGGSATQSFTMTVVQPPNNPPTIESSPVTSLILGNDYSYQLVGADADGDALSYTLINAPAFMNLSSGGLLTWSAIDAAVGSWPIAIEVSDGNDIAIQSFTLVVTEPVVEPPADAIIDPLDFALEFLPANPTAADDVTVRVSILGGSGPVSAFIDVDGVPLLFSNEINLGVLSAGNHTLNIQLEAAGESVNASHVFQVGLGTDVSPPTAVIESEYENTVSLPVSILGTATDENFAFYRVLIAERGTSNFAEITRSDIPVTSGILFEFDPTLYANGTYDLLLEVVDLDSNASFDNTVVSVETDLKAGEMSFTVMDLKLPNAGMPISVYRSYDSRDKHISGDFGHGWRLALSDFSVSSNQTLGFNWFTSSTGGFFPTLCIEPVNPHFVTVARPDGKIDKFNMVLRNNCSTLIPPTVVEFAFEAAPGTYSSLVANEPNQLRVSGGNTLLEQGLFSVFDPRSFTLTDKDGTSYAMTEGGAVTAISDRQGNQLTFSSNGITHTSGQAVIFNRDAQGRITAITDPSGFELTYQYDGAGNLARAIDRNGNVTRYIYNRHHAMLEIRDPLNRPLSQNIYDESGKLIAFVDADGNRTEISANAVAGIKQITAPDGSVTTIEYDADSNPIRETDAFGNTTLRTFNLEGLVTSETDPVGNTRVYVYDSFGNVISETNGLGETISRSYDSFGNLLSETDAAGNVKSFAYDEFNNKIGEVDANGVGQLASTDSNGFVNQLTDSLGRTTMFTRDSSGLALSETEPNGNVISYEYDSNGNQITEQTEVFEPSVGLVTYTIRREFDANGNPTRVEDALGYVEEFEYDALNKLIGYTNKNGHRWTYEFDAYGNRTSINHPDGTQELFTFDYNNNKTTFTDRLGRTTTYVYDSRQNKIEEIFADGSRLQFEYDSANRLVAKVDELGERTEFEYDALNRKISERFADGGSINYVYDIAGNVVSESDPNGNITSRIFDAGNRLVTEIKPDGSTTSFTYDLANRVVSESDSLGNVTTFEYDDFDRLSTITDALGNSTSYLYTDLGKFGTRSYSDDRGALSQMMFPDGRVITWESDILGRNLAEIRNDGLQKQMTYDGQGNVVLEVDFSGQITNRTFNEFDQVETESFSDGRIRNYTYAGNNLVRVDEGSYWTAYEYDLRDRLIRSSDSEGADISYQYDLAGRLLSTQVGTIITNHVRDALGRIVETSNTDSGSTTFSYDLAGNLVSQTNANGSYVSTTYDELNRVTEKTTYFSNGLVMDSERYRYDLVGNLVETRHHDGRVQNFVFDGIGQLTSEIDSSGSSSTETVYTYNANGDRVSRSIDGIVDNYTYDLLGRMLSDGSSSYTYDLNGNLTATSGAENAIFEYDSENRLVRFESASLEERYFYNYRGTRISKTSNGELTRFWIDQLQQYDQVLLEENGANVHHHIYGVGRLATYSSAFGNTYYHTDAKQSVVAISDSTETVLNTYQYDAWGDITSITESIANDFRYNGEAIDDTGLYYLRARYYSANVGRFISPDAFDGLNRIPLTQNQYVYGLNNPVIYGDPSGNIVALIMRAGQIGRYSGIIQRINMLLRYQARGSVKQLRAMKRSKKGIWRDSTRNDEIHHVVEKRFMRRWGIRNVDDTPGAVIPREYHRIYTNRWRQAFPYGTQPSRQQVLNKVYDIYRDDPMMLREALRFLL